MTCKDPGLEQATEVVGVEVKVVNKLAIEGGGEGENRGCRQGGPTKLPAKGGGQQQRPGKEEPLVGWRKEGASDHHQSWSQFLVGFIRPVWWHPPDDGRQCMVVAVTSLQHRLVSIKAILLCEFFSSIFILATQCGCACGVVESRAEPKLLKKPGY